MDQVRIVCEACGAVPEGVRAGPAVADGSPAGSVRVSWREVRRADGTWEVLPAKGEADALARHALTADRAVATQRLACVTSFLCPACLRVNERRRPARSRWLWLVAALVAFLAWIELSLQLLLPRRPPTLFAVAAVAVGLLVARRLTGTLRRRRDRCDGCGHVGLLEVDAVARRRWPCARCGGSTVRCRS